MTRALICRPDGSIVELDLAVATPEEADAAITDHRELELVRALARAVLQNRENNHELD